MAATTFTLAEVRDRLGWTLSAGAAKDYGPEALPEPDAVDPESGEALWSEVTVEANKGLQDRRGLAWKARFEAAAEWWNEHGSWDDASPEIRSWAHRALAPSALKQGPESRWALVANSGMVHPGRGTGQREATWDLLRNALGDWVKEHGTAKVPQRATITLPDGNSFPIGRRVSALRDRYFKGGLSADRIKYLEELPGWAWEANIHEGPWYANMSKVEEITSRDDWNGQVSTLPPALRTWLRRQWNALDRLPREKVGRLLAVQKRFAPASIDTFFAAMTLWLKRNKGLTPSDLIIRTEIVLPGHGRYLVGKRANYYQRRYSGKEKRSGGEYLKPLTDAEVAKIESIPGWTWDGPRAT